MVETLGSSPPEGSAPDQQLNSYPKVQLQPFLSVSDPTNKEQLPQPPSFPWHAPARYSRMRDDHGPPVLVGGIPERPESSRQLLQLRRLPQGLIEAGVYESSTGACVTRVDDCRQGCRATW